MSQCLHQGSQHKVLDEISTNSCVLHVLYHADPSAGHTTAPETEVADSRIKHVVPLQPGHDTEPVTVGKKHNKTKKT
jgi:hypothetical protein